MSLQQRRALDDRLREFAPVFDSGRSIEERRAAIPAAREGFAALMGTMPVPTGFRTEPTALAGRPALRFAVDRAEDLELNERERPGAILYFHGGSFVSGSPETHLGLTGELVVRTGRTAYSIDYRLAPEHPFPAAIDDTTAAYRALLDAGHAPGSIVFAGDSAGGGLTITTALNARRLGLPLPAGIVAFSPGLDIVGTGDSYTSRAAADPLLTRESIQPNRELYLSGTDPHQDLLRPAELADLRGFPPILLQVGTNEILLSDSTRLAERARDADIDVILDITAGVPHVFQTYTADLDEADRALERAALFIDQRLRAA